MRRKRAYLAAALLSAALAAAKVAKESVPAGISCGSNNVVCQEATPCAYPNPGTSNLDKGCLYAKENGFEVKTGGVQNVTLQADTGAIPTVPGLSVAYWVTARVSQTVPQGFSSVLGKSQGTVGARASAAVLSGTEGGCIYVLQPTGTGVSNGGNGLVQSGCGVYVDANSGSAVALNGNATIRTTGEAHTYITGSGWTWTGNATITPAPILNSPYVPDPFASVPPPTVGPCNSNGVNLGSHQAATLNPGVYCNGISLSGQSSVKFNPGLFVIKGNLSGTGQTTIQGTGVTLYFYNGGISLAGGSTVRLSPPTSGTWMGFTIYQNRANTSAMYLSGGSNQTIAGLIYTPSAALSWAGNGNTTGAVLTIVAKTLSFVGNAYIATPATTQYNGPLGGVSLVE